MTALFKASWLHQGFFDLGDIPEQERFSQVCREITRDVLEQEGERPQVGISQWPQRAKKYACWWRRKGDPEDSAAFLAYIHSITPTLLMGMNVEVRGRETRDLSPDWERLCREARPEGRLREVLCSARQRIDRELYITGNEFSWPNAQATMPRYRVDGDLHERQKGDPADWAELCSRLEQATPDSDFTYDLYFGCYYGVAEVEAITESDVKEVFTALRPLYQILRGLI